MGLLAIVAWAALAASLRVPVVREEIAKRLGQLLSDDRRTVTISSLDGSLPFAPTAGVLEIADRRGTWLRIENLAVEIDPRLLLLRHVHLRAAGADRVVFSRLPEPDEEPFVLKPFRLLVTAKRIEARAIELGRELLGADSGPELSAPIAAEAKGWVDLGRLTLAVELSATTPRLDELLGGVDGETPLLASNARLQVKAHGAIETPGGSAKLAVAGVRRGAVSVESLDLEATAERLGRGERRYRMTLAAHANGFEGPPEMAQWLGSSPALSAVVRFGTTPSVFDVDALTLETGMLGAELAGRGGEDGRVEISQLAVTLPDLRSVPDLGSAVAAGALRVRGAAVVTNAWTAPSLEAKLAWEGIDLEMVDAAVHRLLGATPKLSTTLHYEPDRGLTADSVRLVADGLSANANGSVTPQGRIKADVDVDVPDVAALTEATASPLAGALVAALKFDGTLAAFDATATVRPQAMTIRRAEPLAGDIVVTAHRDRGSITGDATAELTFASHPLQAAARYAYESERGLIRVDGLKTVLPGLEAEGRGEVGTSPLLVRGHALLRGRDLSHLAELFGVEAAGEADVSLDLEHDGVRQRVRLNGTARRIRWADVAVEALRLDVTPVAGATTSRFALTANGEFRQDFVVRAQGVATGGFASADVTLERLDGSYAGHGFATRRALRLTVRDGDVALSDGSLDVAGGNVEGEWGAGGLYGVGRLRFTHVPLAILSALRARPALQGSVSGEVLRAKAGGDLELRARTEQASIASASSPDGVGRFELDATALVASRRTRVESSLATPDGTLRFDLVADVPTGIGGTDRRGQLDGRFAGALGAEWIGQALLPEDDRISGRLDITLDLGGTLESPTATGRATGKVQYAGAATGTELRIEQLDVRAEGQRLRIAALKGNDGRDGVIEGHGTVDFSSGFADALYDIEIAFLDTYLARIDEVRLRGDGAVQLTGRGSAARLKGGLTADEAILRLPDRLPPEIATLPVEHVNLAMSRNPQPIAEASAPAVPLALDLALQFPGHLRVEDPNLDSEWRGGLVIRGDTVKPDVQGKLSVLRGRFSLGGVQFRASEGSLSFDEDSDIPTVDVTAVANRNDIEATLRLHGRIDHVEIELRSEPPLPQDEILSRLMFGTTTTTLTAGQSVQLAQAVARLSGKGPGLDVLGRMRRFVGVDRIEIKDSTDTTTGTTTTAVSVGKYVGDRIYVSLDQAVDGEGSKARVEVELTKHISAETEVGQDQNALVGLKWRWNY
jgi:translocation and assembly module TamB